MSPRLSIIVPVFNAEKYLDQCIESIITQNYYDYELILVNDGSTDGSDTICKNYSSKDNRIKYYSTQNRGASHARNIGIKEAKGDYLWFIDADDWIEPNSVNQLLNECDANPDILFFGFKRVFESGDISICKIQAHTELYDKNLILEIERLFTSSEAYFGYTWNKLFKRRIIEKLNLRFNEDLTIKEDEVFSLEYCSNIHSLKIYSHTPYNYRMLNSSISHAKGTKRKMMNLARFMEAYILPNPFYKEMYSKLYNAIFNYGWEGIMEESKSSNFNEAIIWFLNFQKDNHKYAESNKKQRILSCIPTIMLKKLIIKSYIKVHDSINN